MPNRFTRVPEGPVPTLPALGRLLLPLADLFMLAMLSRPETGSLRVTWVTPATLWLCVFVVAVGTPVGLIALTGGVGDGHWLRVAAGGVLILLALGGAAVAVVGVMQRR